MKSRVLGAVLVGLGVLALVFAVGLGFIVAPKVERLPYDMERTQSVAEAPNATFLQITKGVAKVNTGTLRSTVTVQPDAKATAGLEGSLDGNALVWLVGQEVVRTDTNELVLAYSTSLAVDRRTAAAQTWNKQWLDTGNDRQSVKYSGQIYKFPFGTERRTYDIFDRDILTTKPASFVRTEEIQGLETYQFTQEIRDGRQQLPTDRMQVLLSQLTPGAQSGEVVYNNIRTVWVEPTTGQYIKVQEKQNKVLKADNGQSVTILDATFTYTDDTITKSADTAKSNRQRLNLVTLWAPIGLAVLGLILLIVAVLMLRRSGNAGAGGAPARHAKSDRDETLVESRSSD
ncbi:DUF3068 domain-containing protein [Actinoplanes sp. NPDC051633]|uniref:DUF3068 domain-containing protein n=1 Tax=Actinoplanes sp. NPDC051633 TaxID=3155670 RepID=UPI00343E7D34